MIDEERKRRIEQEAHILSDASPFASALDYLTGHNQVAAVSCTYILDMFQLERISHYA